MPDELTLASLVANLGAVGGFIYYSIKVSKSNGEERQKRDKEWRDFLQTQQTSFLESIGTRDGHWSEMFKLQAEQRGAAMSQGMEQMREVTEQIRGLVSIFLNHETTAAERTKSILDAINSIRASKRK